MLPAAVPPRAARLLLVQSSPANAGRASPVLRARALPPWSKISGTLSQLIRELGSGAKPGRYNQSLISMRSGIASRVACREARI